jgi:hypothetical protein
VRAYIYRDKCYEYLHLYRVSKKMKSSCWPQGDTHLLLPLMPRVCRARLSLSRHPDAQARRSLQIHYFILAVLLLKGLNLLAEAEKSYIKRRRPEESCRREGGRGEKVPAGHSAHCCKRWGGGSSAREMTTRSKEERGQQLWHRTDRFRWGKGVFQG